VTVALCEWCLTWQTEPVNRFDLRELVAVVLVFAACLLWISCASSPEPRHNPDWVEASSPPGCRWLRTELVGVWRLDCLGEGSTAIVAPE
jgi:hypothetical protein